MSVKKYCYCENNCKYETLDKEEILAAIAQAVETGTIGECNTGFITTIKTINGQPLKFFVGEQSQYEALSEESKQNLFAIITNDTTKENLLNTLDKLQTGYDELIEGLDKGTKKPKIAQTAEHLPEYTEVSGVNLNDYKADTHIYVRNPINAPSGVNAGYFDVFTKKTFDGEECKQQITDTSGNIYTRVYTFSIDDEIGDIIWNFTAWKKACDGGAAKTAKSAESAESAAKADILNNGVYQASQLIASDVEIDLNLAYGHDYLIQVILDNSYKDATIGNTQSDLQCLSFVLSIPPLEVLTPKYNVLTGIDYYIYSSMTFAKTSPSNWHELILRINPTNLKCKLMKKKIDGTSWENYTQLSNAIAPTVFRVSTIKSEVI